MNAIKDILLRSKVSLQRCRGRNGEASKLLVEQPKTLATYSRDQSINLAVKDLITCCKKLCDVMSTVSEICVLIKGSKRENILKRMQKYFEGNFDLLSTDNLSTDKFSTLQTFCLACWTVHASCFQKVVGNYCLLLKLGINSIYFEGINSGRFKYWLRP